MSPVVQDGLHCRLIPTGIELSIDVLGPYIVDRLVMAGGGHSGSGSSVMAANYSRSSSWLFGSVHCDHRQAMSMGSPSRRVKARTCAFAVDFDVLVEHIGDHDRVLVADGNNF